MLIIQLPLHTNTYTRHTHTHKTYILTHSHVLTLTLATHTHTHTHLPPCTYHLHNNTYINLNMKIHTFTPKTNFKIINKFKQI